MDRAAWALGDVLRGQSSVVSRVQLVELGWSPGQIRSRLDGGRWQRLLPGVYLAHTGPVPWRARAWAAVLHAGPGAALSHAAAAHLHGFGPPPRVLDVSVPADRRVTGAHTVVVHRRRTMPAIFGVLPAIDAAPTVVDLAAVATTARAGTRSGPDEATIALISAAVRAGVPLEAIRAELERRGRVRGRARLAELVGVAAEGIESALELRYRRDVERAHSLPRAVLQVRQVVGGCWVRADALYLGLHVRVELDGELGHPGGRTDADTWRDNAVLVERAELTLRYRWRHVASTPCATAAQVVAALRSRGWQGRPRPCGPRCPLSATPRPDSRRA